ncbi:MAG TPA: ATP-binding protein [Gaiellaceae bacterium]|jgi:C4-dicarboxylate-specific signal transduction histidine kinase
MTDPGTLADAGIDESSESLRARVAELERRVRQAEERRRALLHIMGDLNDSNKRLGEQRKAMLHILKDSHESNLRLEGSRKAMIHIMGDLRETTAEMERREHELRQKQEQLVQAGKLATLGELTTGVAHELNNPLNNIGLFVGNIIDRIRVGEQDMERIEEDLEQVVEQVQKATEIITHLRTFGRAAPVTLEPVAIQDVIHRALSLVQEQLRLRLINVHLDLLPQSPVVLGSAIQLEQVFINLLANARDALEEAEERGIHISCREAGGFARVVFRDTGPGIPPGLDQRIFDPFFTTKEVGSGTGLGLSITYGILQEHEGAISVTSPPGAGASFTVDLPLLLDAQGAI